MKRDEDRATRATQAADAAMRLHRLYHSKIQALPKSDSFEDFAIWYSPDVATSDRAIQRDPALVYEHTKRGNHIAVVSDGSLVLGLATSVARRTCRSWRTRR